MAAPKGKKTLDSLFDEVMIDIAESGMAAITALKGKMSVSTFYDLLKDSEKSKRYARATEMRADRIAEEIMTIADNQEGDVYKNADGVEFINHNVINRARLRVDSRKWILAKMNPKKYGDKIDMTSGNEKIESGLNITVSTEKCKQEIHKLSEGN
jgi:hypothetical protein